VTPKASVGPHSTRAPERRTSEERDTDDLARGAGVNYLGYIARIAPRAIFLVLAGRFYGEAHFGIYTFGLTVVETLAGSALFGMKRSLFKFMSEAVAAGKEVHGAIAHGIALALMVGTPVTLALGFASPWIAELFGLPDAARPLVIFTIALPMIVVSDILLVAIRFTRQMRFEVYARSLVEPITLTGALLVVWWLGAEQLALAVAYSASLTAAAATTVFFFVRVFPMGPCLRAPLHWGELRRMATFSGPTAVYDFLTMLFDRVDIFLVSYFLPASTVGIYGMARQLSTVTKKIRAGFDRILPPVLSENIEADDLGRADRQLALVSRWILTVQTLFVLFFFFFGTDVLGLFGSGFAGGALILAFLMVGDAVHGALGISELPFVYLKPGWNAVFGATFLALGAGLNVWFIQLWGGEGAALAVLFTVALVNGARIAANRWTFDLAVIDLKILKPVAAAIPAALAMVGVQALVTEPFLRVLLGVPTLLLVYFGALALLGLEPEDQAQVRRIMGG